jgi:hypothetical protein
MDTMNTHNNGQENRPVIQLTRPGQVVAISVCDNMVTVWVDSPTGDSSDSHLFTFPARTNAQALIISEMWGKTWGLDPQFYAKA